MKVKFVMQNSLWVLEIQLPGWFVDQMLPYQQPKSFLKFYISFKMSIYVVLCYNGYWRHTQIIFWKESDTRIEPTFSMVTIISAKIP